MQAMLGHMMQQMEGIDDMSSDPSQPRVDNTDLLASLPTFKFNPDQFKNCGSEN